MIRKINIFVCLVLIVTVLFSACSNKTEDSGIVEINPNDEALNTDSFDASLYFANSNYTNLVAFFTNIDVPVSSTKEYVALKALIAGPSARNTSFSPVINPSTSIIDISENENILSVVLSKEFLDFSFIPDTVQDAESRNYIKQLAVYSIVNTLIDISGKGKVQLLVDRYSNGYGRRIYMSEVGFTGDRILEAMSRNNRIILNSNRTLENICNALSLENYDEVYKYLSVSEKDSIKGDLNSFKTWISALNIKFDTYIIVEQIDQNNIYDKLIVIDYSLIDEEGNRREFFNVPVHLKKENGLWKIPYSMLEALLEH